MKTLQVAETILEQLGGTRRLSLMIGASLFAGSDEAKNVCFSFKGSRKMNRVRITLNGLDLYTVEFFKYKPRSAECPKVAEVENVYADQLVTAFENQTGLYITL